MADNKYSIDYIRQTLKSELHPCYENTAKTEVYCRCPNCGDSKNKSAAHLYIKMKPPFSFYCHKCGYTGVLTESVLHKLQVYNNDLVLNVIECNKDNHIDTNTIRRETTKELNFEFDESAGQKALDYFNSRFGTEISAEEATKTFKGVLDPISFLKKNNINIDFSKTKFDFSNAIGFVSSDNKYLVCRSIDKNAEMRYSNVCLTPNDDSASKIYNIHLPVDIMEDEITLVITEGIFDAIGIYLKEYQSSENVIIAAGCGKSFKQVIEKFIQLGFLNLKIKIYSDADVELSTYTALKKAYDYLQNVKLEIYYNELEKDYGVSADKIKLNKIII